MSNSKVFFPFHKSPSTRARCGLNFNYASPLYFVYYYYYWKHSLTLLFVFQQVDGKNLNYVIFSSARARGPRILRCLPGVRCFFWKRQRTASIFCTINLMILKEVACQNCVMIINSDYCDSSGWRRAWIFYGYFFSFKFLFGIFGKNVCVFT